MSLSSAELDISRGMNAPASHDAVHRSLDLRRLLVIGGAGFAASIVMAITASHIGGPFPGTHQAWWFQFSLIQGSPTADAALMLALFYAALVVMAVCWVAIVRTPVRHLRMRLVVGLIVLWAIPFAAGPPIMSNDVYLYGTYGHQLALGYDVYTQSPNALPVSDPFRVDTDLHNRSQPGNSYGPVFMRLAQLTATLGQGNVFATVMLDRLLALLGLALIGLAGVPLARRAGRDPTQALALVLLSPFTLLNFVSGAHNDAVMVGLLVAGVSLVVVKRWLIPGLLLCSAATAVKTPMFVVVGFLGWAWPGLSATLMQRLRSTVGAVIVGLAGLGVIGLAARLGFGWVSASWISWNAPLSPVVKGGYLIGDITGSTASALALLRYGALGVALVITVVLFLGTRALLHETATRGAVVAAGLSLLALAVLSPAFHLWYLLWAIALVGFTTNARRLTWLLVVVSALGVANLPSG